jgi:hypothetical protein
MMARVVGVRRQPASNVQVWSGRGAKCANANLPNLPECLVYMGELPIRRKTESHQMVGSSMSKPVTDGKVTQMPRVA